MATSVSRVSALLTVAAAVVALGNVPCTPKPNGPEPTAEQFFAALATGDTGAAARAERPARRCAPGAQRRVGRAAGDPSRRADPELEVRRGHRQRHLPLHLAPAQGPHLDLRRAAEHGPRRGPVGKCAGAPPGCTPSSARTRRWRCAPTRPDGLRSTNAAALTCWCPAICTTSRWTPRRRPER